MKALLIFISLLLWSCSACGGNSHLDSGLDGGEAPDDGREAGDRDQVPVPDLRDSPGEDLRDPLAEDPPGEISEAVDQRPADCFSPIDAPVYDISTVWEAVEPDREPMPCEGCCRQVTFGPYDDWFEYDVWGTYVIYGIKDIHTNNVVSQVMVKNFEESTEYIVHEVTCDPGVNLDLVERPMIFEDTLVYVHIYFVSTEMTRCDLVKGGLTTGTTEIIHSFDIPGTGAYWCPGGFSPMDMYGRYAVYESNRQGFAAGQQIYLLDVETGEESQISLSTGGVGFPRIWKNRVVYFGWYEGNAEVYLYDIDTGLTENLTYREGEHTEEIDPAIWENLVAFRQGPTEAEIDFLGDVYMMDIGVRDFIPVCLDPATVIGRVDIFEDLVAWSDLRNDPCPNLECRHTNTDVYYYRISTGAERRTVSNPGIEGYARIWENRIFFAMKDSADIINVFMVEAQ